MFGRPKKYFTEQQRKAAKKRSIAPQIKSSNFRLVIPNLTEFTDSIQLLKLKGDTLKLLLQKQADLQYYKIAAQTHPTSGIPHLDILLLYRRSVQKSINRFDYLIKHGHLTRYRHLNQAIIEYGDKEDIDALSNMPKETSMILKAKQLQLNPYSVLKQQMLKNPLQFNPYSWISANNLDSILNRTNWSKAISLLTKIQQVQCNQRLHDKLGFNLITKNLIKQQLTVRQYAKFNKNKIIFGKIIQKLNEIAEFGTHRPHKTKNLLLVGPPNTGKTSLALQIQKHTSVYYMGVHNWFPAYRSGVYRMILWNQFNLRAMSYPELLNFLEGSKMDLQYKGGSTLKTDNQLVFMTSNMTLSQHINSRFKSKQSRALAEANLRARIDQVILPRDVDLFLLQKLLIRA